jgi:glycosyltransferase involved in cell wall biosynthesis
LHWDLRRNADFYARFDGGGRVFYAGVSDAQVARGPELLRRQTLGAVPLAVPASAHPEPAARAERAAHVVALGRICRLKGTALAVRAARAAGLPVVLAGPVAGCPDGESLRVELADPSSPLHGNADVRYFVDEVAPLLDGVDARWIGTVTGPAKEDLLRYARAALFPVCWEEPGGTAVCEALTAGTPVVALARGCLPSLVDHGVTGFLAGDQSGLVDGLRRLDDLDPAACMAVGRRRFGPAVMAAGYERLYAQVVGRAAARGQVPGPRPSVTGAKAAEMT